MKAEDVREFDLMGYMDYMEKENFASSTISRSVASMRAFFQHMFALRKMEENPTDHRKSPKVEKNIPEILRIQEVDDLLKQPDLTTPKGIRDKAMLELFICHWYACQRTDPSGDHRCKPSGWLCGLPGE